MKRFVVLVGALVLIASTAFTQTINQTYLLGNESAVITAPTSAAVGSGGSCTVGAHSFAITIVAPDSNGIATETGLGNASSATCITSDSVNLTVIPLGSGYATARNVYATKAGTTTPFYFVATIADNTSTTYTYTLADTSLVTQAKVINAALPAKPLWAIYSNGPMVPVADNLYTLGSATQRVSTLHVVTEKIYNATSGNITIAAPTGALLTPTVTLPALTGSLGTGYSCGASLAAAGVCANTAQAGTFHFHFGSALLSGSTSTITGISPAYTSATSWWCVANDITTRANPVQAIPGSGTTLVITNTTGATDLIQFICFGN